MKYGRTGGLQSTRILLVEDAEDIRNVFAQAAERQQFDIVLTDLGLPDIPGDAVIRQVLAKAPRRPRVVVLTGYNEPFMSRARQAGADIVLNKPIAWPDLVEHLVRDEATEAMAA